MIKRLLQVTKNKSFFLFGARGTGKSTFLHQNFNKDECLWIDLLKDEEEHIFSLHPDELISRVKALKPEVTHIIIDEVQKIPKLLNVVHFLIENTDKTFILTGSSARKLKYGAANLLAGRAFVYNLYPFSFQELGENFHLEHALNFGLLPRLIHLNDDDEKKLFLQAYTQTYLKEEIWAEQLIRKLDPFRKFLEVAAQCNGKILNYLNIARDVGVDDKTIQTYFQILEDTLIGFYLAPFHTSVRKRLSKKPKFYFFDVGVVRALSRVLSVPVTPRTSQYGEYFEQFIICEIHKLCSYFHNEYKLTYFQTKDGCAIDLIIERPGKTKLFIEIKSTTSVSNEHVSLLNQVSKDFPDDEFICLSNDRNKKQMEHVLCLYWQELVTIL